MSRNAGRLFVLASVLLTTGACTEPSALVSPGATPRVIVTTPRRPAQPPVLPDFTPDWPPLSRAGRAYVAPKEDWPSFPIQGSIMASRYVLYDDGAFALQTSSVKYPLHEYRGTYKETDGTITFEWEGWSVAGPWGAMGAITPESLDVHYNLVMMMTDFIDGMYLRQQ